MPKDSCAWTFWPEEDPGDSFLPVARRGRPGFLSDRGGVGLLPGVNAAAVGGMMRGDMDLA
jgi:hypothetical protein